MNRMSHHVAAKMLSGPLPRPCCRASRSTSSRTAALVFACSLNCFFLRKRKTESKRQAVAGSGGKHQLHHAKTLWVVLWNHLSPTKTKGMSICSCTVLSLYATSLQIRHCHLFFRSSSKDSILNRIVIQLSQPRLSSPWFESTRTNITPPHCGQEARTGFLSQIKDRKWCKQYSNSTMKNWAYSFTHMPLKKSVRGSFAESRFAIRLNDFWNVLESQCEGVHQGLSLCCLLSLSAKSRGVMNAQTKNQIHKSNQPSRCGSFRRESTY